MAEIHLWHLPGIRPPHHSTHSLDTAKDYTTWLLLLKNILHINTTDVKI